MRWLAWGLWALLWIAPVRAEGPGGARDDTGPRVAVRWWPEAPAQGDPLLVEVEAPAGWEVGGTFQKHHLRFFRWAEGKVRALAPISVLTRPGEVPLQVVLTRKEGAGREVVTRTVGVVVAAARFEQSELKVDPRFTSPPRRARARIRRERARIRRAWRRASDRRLWRGAFLRPTRSEKTGAFGTERVFNGRVESRHLGLDLDGKVGDPIRAAADGRVVLAGHLYYTGRCVFIDHGLGLFTVYFHMSKLSVREGQRVHKGQILGKVGRSGRVTGPHLHFGVKLDGVYVRPSTLLTLPLDDDPALGGAGQ